MKSSFRMVSSLVALLLLSTLLMAFSLPGLGKSTTVKPANGVVTIPTAKVSDGQAHYFTLKEGETEINFFVVKAKDGQFRVAFDACEVCYEAKKGYRQEGDIMVCNKCNKKFPVEKIGPHTAGGCNPIHLPHQLVGGNLVIKVEDIRKGLTFFE